MGEGKTLKWATTGLAVITGLYQLYVAAFGTSSTTGLRITHWVLMVAMCFLIFPFFGKKNTVKFGWIADLLWIAAGVAPGIYLLATESSRVGTVRLPTTLEEILGILLIVTVLEAARRTSGWALPIISGTFLTYALFGHLIPGVLGHRPYSLERIISYQFLSADGIFGIALGVSATFIVLFVLFGSFLTVSGAGQLFIDGVLAATGHHKGGPAKTAVLSSALMGMLSGSPVANVVTTGTYTIPLMKRIGYKDYEAGAIEAVASTGGMITPPIMGAAAFIMADYLGMTYGRIALAAALPAFLYYLSLYWSVHYRAHKSDVKTLNAEDLPDLKASVKKGWYLLLPIIVLIILLVVGYSATYSALISIVMLFAIMAISPDRKKMLPVLIAGIEDGIRNSVPVAAACAVAGIIVGVVNQTGLGIKFSTFMVDAAGGNSFLLLVTTMIASLILGMGLPATAVYVLLATLSAPALIKIGFTPLASHMFVYYFGIISAITPPVALSAFAAAGLAKSDPNKTGFHSFALGLTAYIVPFMFTYNPALLMEGGLAQIIQVTITSIIGVTAFATGVERYLDRPLVWWESAMCVVGGLLLMVPETVTDFVGLGLLAAFAVIHFLVLGKRAKPAADMSRNAG